MNAPLPVRWIPGLAERAWFTPPRPRPQTLARDTERLLGTQPITVAVEGVDRPGYTVGTGPLVVLAHGWGGRAGQMIDLATALGQSGFQAVVVDAPGHGTDLRPTSDGFQMAAALAAVADRYGPPQAVVAHSLGALAAVLAFGREFPPAAVFLAPVLDAAQSLDVFSERAGLMPWTARSLRRRFRRFAGDSWSGITAGANTDLGRSQLLVAHDPADPDSPFATSAELVQRRPRSRLVAVPDAGHHRLPRHPRVIAAASRFLIEVATDAPLPREAS